MRLFACALVVGLVSLAGLGIDPGWSGSAQEANRPPEPPRIRSMPDEVNPEDVHMETEDATDPDPADRHVATDWEIWTNQRGEEPVRVWAAHNSPSLTHAHLPDGVFEGPLAFENRLDYKASYELRVRFRDSSGDPATEWSEWASYRFDTMNLPYLPVPLVVRDVVSAPRLEWHADGTPVVLPSGAGSLLLETSGRRSLYALIGSDSGENARVDWEPLLQAAPLHVRIAASPDSDGLQLPASTLSFVTDTPQRITLWLPALELQPGQSAAFWVSGSGVTYELQGALPDPTSDPVAAASPVPWAVRDGFLVEPVVDGLSLPTNLAFVPHPREEPTAPLYYIAELPGRITVVDRLGRSHVFAPDALDFELGTVPGPGETGLIGLCVQPETGAVFATRTVKQDGELHNQIVRFDSQDGLAASGQTMILSIDSEPSAPSHQIQQCAFGPDGKLYVMVADALQAAKAQSDTWFAGKLLRLNPDGSAPEDNPFYDPAQAREPLSYQYAKGFRNPYGLTVRRSDGQLYFTENGRHTDRLGKVVAGLNYGWEGSDAAFREHAIYNWEGGSWAPMALAFAEGTAFPAQYQDRLYVASSGGTYSTGQQSTGKQIQEFALDETGNLIRDPTTFVRYIGTGKATVAGLAFGPDGLYFTDLYPDHSSDAREAGARVWRVRYVGQADFSASATSGAAPLTVQFTDTSTLDAVAWCWDFGDGQISEEQHPQHVFDQPGSYVVSLTATTVDGVTREKLLTINVTGP